MCVPAMLVVAAGGQGGVNDGPGLASVVIRAKSRPVVRARRWAATEHVGLAPGVIFVFATVTRLSDATPSAWATRKPAKWRDTWRPSGPVLQTNWSRPTCS